MVKGIKCDKKSERLSEAVVHTYIESLVKAGILDVAGKSNKEILVFISDYIHSHPNINWVVDHRQDILNNARIFRGSRKNEMACLNYATSPC